MGLSPDMAQTIKDTLEKGVRSTQSKITNTARLKAKDFVDKTSIAAYKAGNKFLDQKVASQTPKKTLQHSPSATPKKIPRRKTQSSSKLAGRKRKAPALTTSSKKKRPVNIQNYIEQA